jgi:hypothetical protein
VVLFLFLFIDRIADTGTMAALNADAPREGKPKQTHLPLPPLCTSLPPVAEAETEIETMTITLVQEKAIDSIITSSEPHTQHNPAHPTIEDYDPHIGAKPCSPFYRHATPSSKLSRLTSQRKRSRSVGMVTSPIDDLEGGAPAWQRLYDDEAKNTPSRESKLWVQEKRHCDCLSGLSKRRRMAVKIAIAVVVLGSMVAIALGITAAVGGGVWSGDHQQERFG